MTLTQKEEQELLRNVRDMHEAWVGSIDGKVPGAMHMLQRIYGDFYNPEDPDRAVINRVVFLESLPRRVIALEELPPRVIALENESQQRSGAKLTWAIVWAPVAIIVGGCAEALFTWLFSGRK
jgi:hypothetical protein